MPKLHLSDCDEVRAWVAPAFCQARAFKEQFQIRQQAWLILLHKPQIVSTCLDHLCRERPLGLHRVTCHNDPGQVELSEQLGHCHNLVLLALNGQLGQHHTTARQIGSNQMEPTSLASGDSATQGFTIDDEQERATSRHVGVALLFQKELA